MAEWRTPVYDRTMDDVKSVDRTSAEYQKGTLNADDLNRIEDNYKYLLAKLKSDAIFIPHRLRNYTETVVKCVQRENRILPDGYTQVEYIEMNGTQFIDTDFIPNQDSGFVIDFVLSSEYLDNNNSFGCRKTTGANAFTFSTVSGKWRFGYNNSSAASSVDADAERHTVSVNKNVCSLDGVVIDEKDYADFTGYTTFAIGAIQASSLYYGYLRVYGGQLLDNGVEVRDYLPCINAESTAGLYDLVNDVFYGNAGTGTFVVGPEIEPEVVYEFIEEKTTYTDWQENNLPWLSEINRIRTNHNAFVRLFLVGLGFSEMTESNYLDYLEVNQWEKALLLGKTMFENMEKEYRYCGIEESGGDRLL